MENNKQMINANELRIGNLVTDEFYESFKTIIKVEDLNIEGINLEICDDGNYPEIAKTWIAPSYTFDKLYGIPLTEEILLKCGFWRGGYEYLFLYNGKLEISGIGDTYGIRLNNTYDIEIKYIHQLQNLYFALTGEELEINL